MIVIVLLSHPVFARHKNPSSTPLLPTQSVTGNARTLHHVKVTWYGSGGRCNSARPCYIAYARINGYPAAFHNIATEGTGAVDDPITLAANKKAFPVGTLIYIPTFKKYFVFEDKCPRCGYSKTKPLHIDLFQGPSVGGNARSLSQCARKMNAHNISIIVSPDHDLPVEITPFLTSKGLCKGKKFQD